MTRLLEVIPGLLLNLDEVLFAHYYRNGWEQPNGRERDSWCIRFTLRGTDRAAEAVVYTEAEAKEAVSRAATMRAV